MSRFIRLSFVVAMLFAVNGCNHKPSVLDEYVKLAITEHELLGEAKTLAAKTDRDDNDVAKYNAKVSLYKCDLARTRFYEADQVPAGKRTLRTHFPSL